MATISMPKKELSEDDVGLPTLCQARETPARFRLQVDSQTKASFATLDEAENAGRAIKKAHPVVHVSIYDPVKEQQTVLN